MCRHTARSYCLMDFGWPLFKVAARSITLLLATPLLFIRALLARQHRLLAGPAKHSGIYHRRVGLHVMELKGRIVVFSIVGCPHCMRAKSTLQDLGLPYTNIGLDSYPTVREWVREKAGKSTVPQIFFNAIHVGGNEDLQKLVANKEEFEKVLDEVRNNKPPKDAPEIPDPSTAVEGTADFTCEPDEYATLVSQLKESGIIKDQRKGLTSHKSVFTGREFVDWVVNTKQLDRAAALEMGQQLIDKRFGHQVKKEDAFRDDDTFYRLLEDDTTTALNRGEISDCDALPAGKLGEEIRKLILKIYDAFLSPDGKKVNYAGIAGSDEFKKFCRLASLLQRVDVSNLSRDELLAFFINIYNAQVIHANIVAGPPQNMWQRYKFFNTQRYMIGGHVYSLQDIENGVLRANRKGVGMLTRPFGKSDPRLKVALTEPEPLIHFALVCGAKSCPPIKTYSADGIQEQLRLAGESFLEGDDALKIDVGRRRVSLSMIFKWYREDFGANDHQVVEFVLKLMADGEKKAELNELVSQGNVRVDYMTYDWSTNSK